MIPLNPWEHQNAIKTLYAKCVEGVCEKHAITRMELDILLFLANNPLFDTATDIVEIRFLSKSQVSASVRLLEQHGHIRREYTPDNKKTAHLKLCEKAAPVVADGREAQERFLAVMFRGFEDRDIEIMKRCFDRMWENINNYNNIQERMENV